MKTSGKLNRLIAGIGSVFTVVMLLLYGGGAWAESITTDTYDYKIHYNNNNPSNTEKYCSDHNAQHIADQYDPDSGTGCHEAHLNLGYREADFWFGGKRDVQIEKVKRSNAAIPSRIELSAECLRDTGYDNPDALALCGHELHHMVQYQYIPWGTYFLSLYPWGIEGPAVASEDALLSSSDDGPFDNSWVGYGGGFYVQSAVYLDGNYTDAHGGQDYSDNVWNNDGYASGLFWKYLMEQFGDVRAEPGVGVDVLQDFYTWADIYREGEFSTLEFTIGTKDRKSTAATDYNMELDEVFRDFTIANWVRRYRNPDYSGYTVVVNDPWRFYYLDEDPATNNLSLLQEFFVSGSNWDPVNDLSDARPPATDQHSLAPGAHTGIGTNTACNWGADYVACTFSGAGTNTYGVGVWLAAEEGAKAWFSVIGRRHSGRIDLIEPGTVHPDTGGGFQYATMQSNADPYVELIAVANGQKGSDYHELFARYHYNFAYFAPALEIVEPNSQRRAHVGEYYAPDRFIARLRVQSPDYLGAGSLTGLRPEHFTVYVGNVAIPSNRAEVISAAYVLGEYWLTVQPPTRLAAVTNPVSLIVHLGGISAIEEDAVFYDHLRVDQMLVLDRSGSMGMLSGDTPRYEAMRNAAQLFIDASGSDDQIGVVRFNGNQIEPDGTNLYYDGQTIWHLGVMNSQFERDLVNLLIDDTNPGGDMLAPTGYTSIGDGLYWGAKEIMDRGQPDAERWVVLLSDGHQNEDVDYAAVKALYDATGTRIETIALGSGCDKNLLQTMANETSGRYYEVPALTNGSGTRRAASATASTNSMLLDLADVFLQSSERIHRRERFLDARGLLSGRAARTFTLNLVEGGIENAVISLYAGSSGSGLDLTVKQPDGNPLPPPDGGYTVTNLDPSGHFWDPDFHKVFRLDTMTNGTWSLTVTNMGADSQSYLLVVSGRNRQGAQVWLYFAQFHGVDAIYAQNGLYLRGLPMPIVAVLSDGRGPIRNADVLATVTHPGRSPVFLRLRDDGGAYDGRAGDGVYAAEFAATTEYSGSGGGYAETNPPCITGSYQVGLRATGTDNYGRPFTRIEHGAFHIYEGEGGDTDGDGMPNRYEIRHRGLSPFVSDAGGDADGDGLSNGDEYQRGTAPDCLDTDGGGETDRSEVDHGSNPLDYMDDALMPPVIARVHDWFTDACPEESMTNLFPRPGQNIITFSAERGYHEVELARATNVLGPFMVITNIPATTNGGFYLDAPLINNQVYYYTITPLDASGRRGVPSAIFMGRPRMDYEPPNGNLSINYGARCTDTNTVTLTLNVAPDATQMKIGISPNLDALPWVPFSAVVTNFSLGIVSNGDFVLVSALVRDAADNRVVLRDGITYLDPARAGVIRGVAVAPLDTDNAGIDVTVRGSGGSGAAITPASGVFRIVIPTGTYTAAVNARGYATESRTGIVVQAGAETNLGVITLTSIDTDGDTLSDVAEARDYGTSIYAADSDGDTFNDNIELLVLLTDPTNRASHLAVSTLIHFMPATGQLRFAFQSRPTVTYRFDWSTNLVTWSAVMDGAAPQTVTATGDVTAVTLTLPDRAAPLYYINANVVSGP